MNAVAQTKPLNKPKLPGFINLVLVIILGILAAKLMWMILTPAKKLDYQVQKTGVVSGAQRKVVNYGKLIADQHLFGEIKKAVAVKSPPKAVEEPAPAPKKLNLKLHGIVAYNNKKGFALISLNGGSQKVFGENEEIEKGVVVTKIYPEKVVLNNHGKLEDLLLPVKKIKDKGSATASLPSPAGAQSFRANAAPPAIAPGHSLQRAGSVNLSAFREKVMADPRKLMDIGRPSPAIENGQFIGFRVQPGSQRKLFRQLGFRPNDIIMEVNGIVLDDPSKGAMVLGELAQASDLSIKVKRGNQELYLQHSF